jgi:site-specific DNA-methyltransferase (adenine-specific)
MIWNKGGFSAVGALRTRYAPVFEYMFVFTKGKIRAFNPIKDRPNKNAGKTITGTVRNADGSLKAMSSVGNVLAEFGQRFNIWDISPHRQRGGHPAPFPLDIALDHIASWSNPADIVLDPFAGSGTTAVAAESAARKWICIERDEEYAEKAMARIREHVLHGGKPMNKPSRLPKATHDIGQTSLF